MDNEAIKEIGEKGGTLEDLAGYDQKAGSENVTIHAGNPAIACAQARNPI